MKSDGHSIRIEEKDVRNWAKAHGYELRRKAKPLPKEQTYGADGEPLKDTQFPHFCITKMLRARVWKVTKDGLKLYGLADNCAMWGKYVLALEHINRWRKHEIDDPAMQRAITRLLTPLKKEEYLKPNRKGGNNKKEVR